MNRRLTPPPIPAPVMVLDRLSRLLLWSVFALGLGLFARQLVSRADAPVQRVIVEGDTLHQSATILRPYLKASTEGNFWTLDLARIAQSINDVPWVRSVSVQRDFPAGLRLHIEEHQAVAWWSEVNGNRLVNQFGEVFEATFNDEALADQLPVLDGPVERSADLLRAYVSLQASLRDMPMQARALRLSPHGSWQATLSDNVVLALGRDDVATWHDKLTRVNQTLNSLRQHYTQALSSIDLRYPNGFAVSLHGVSVGPQL